MRIHHMHRNFRIVQQPTQLAFLSHDRQINAFTCGRAFTFVLPDRLDRAFAVGDFRNQMVDLVASTVNPCALQFSTRVQAMLVI